MADNTIPDQNSVILITIDSLRPDYLGCYGHEPTPSPFLDSLFQEGYDFSSCFSTGYPTQFSLPSLLSSTLPLDYKGYDKGISRRPTTLAEVFSSKGYHTGGFVTTCTADMPFGYDRGFQDFVPLYELDWWIRMFRGIYIKRSLKKINEGDIKNGEVLCSLSKYIKYFLSGMKMYCERRIKELNKNTQYPTRQSPLLHNRNYNKINNILSEACRKYNESPIDYAKTLLDQHPNENLLEKLKNTKLESNINGEDKYLKIHMLLTSLRPYFSKIFFKNPKITINRFRDWIDDPLKGSTCSAGYVLDNVHSFIRKNDSPVFAWAHLMDIHKQNLFTWEENEGSTQEKEKKIHQEHLRKISKTNSYVGSPRYDLSIRYIDLAIKRFLQRVNKTLKGFPLVIITADHGWHLLPVRDGDHVTWFFDDVLKIPTVFYHPLLNKGTFGKLSSSIDIGPSLLEFLGYEVPDDFKGKPISELKSEGRKYIIAEDMGRGPCEPSWKPANICVRSKDHKLICSSNIYNKEQFEINKVYDLSKHPNEEKFQNTIHNDKIKNMLERAKERDGEIKRMFDSTI